jgi:hypothetical protein
VGGGVKTTETKLIGLVEFEYTQNEVKYIIYGICFGVSGHEFLYMHSFSMLIAGFRIRIRIVGVAGSGSRRIKMTRK